MDEPRETDRRQVGELQRKVDRHEDRLAQLATVPGALIDIDRRLADSERRQAAIEVSLKANTDITQQIRDAQIAGKIVSKFLGWLAGAAAAVGAVYALFYQLVNHGKVP